MMNIRIVPVLMSALLTGAVLFGGWFGYRHFAVEQPLAGKLNGVEGVAVSETAVSDGRVKVEVELDGSVELGGVFREIRSRLEPALGSRELELVIRQQPDEKLEAIWSTALFEVAQAMENRQYADIPKTASRLMDDHPGLVVNTDMDEYNVYMTLKLDRAVKYVVLPRQPVVLGVWPHA